MLDCTPAKNALHVRMASPAKTTELHTAKMSRQLTPHKTGILKQISAACTLQIWLHWHGYTASIILAARAARMLTPAGECSPLQDVQCHLQHPSLSRLRRFVVRLPPEMCLQWAVRASDIESPLVISTEEQGCVLAARASRLVDPVHPPIM